MAIETRPPNTIYLGGPVTRVGDVPAIEEITPGMLIELHDDGGVRKWGVHDAADEPVSLAVALEQLIFNKGVDDVYAADDLVEAGHMAPGSVFWGLVPSGQDINVGDRLQSNGDGKLKAATAGGDVRFVAQETLGAVNADTRLRVEVI